MLSRSSSNAGERLRRGKSTSSTHTTSSGHQRSTTTIDPFVTKQHAESAAHEAYKRAQLIEQAKAADKQAAQRPKPQRRRSQVSGRVEGSHLEDARLGRRRSTARHEERKEPQKVRPVRHADFSYSVEEKGDETIISKRRTVIPPPSSSGPANYGQLSVPASTRQIRRSCSTYADGSPKPRSTSAFKDQDSVLRLAPSRYPDGVNPYAGFSDAAPSPGSPSSPRASIRENQTNEEILALARDRYLLDFKQKDVRKRKSFILGSLSKLQRRQVTVSGSSTNFGYDGSVPPFNYADDSTVAPEPSLVATTPTYPAVAVAESRTNNRNFSGSVKGRFKKLLRKASRAPSGLPLQQVEATHTHHNLNRKEISPAEISDILRKTSAGCSQEMLLQHSIRSTDQVGSVSSKTSASAESAARSRVTSWTNSTVAGSVGTRLNPDHLPAATETGALQRSTSISTLKKKGSFFGRAVQNRLRKASRAELRSSDESAALYSALQERIRPTMQQDGDRPREVSGSSSASEAVSAIATLPSQQPPPVPTRSMMRKSTLTIRAVSPDPDAFKLMSPVVEVYSPQGGRRDSDASEKTPTNLYAPRTRPQQLTANSAPLTQAQLVRRAERSQNRWQGPLDDLSPRVDDPYVERDDHLFTTRKPSVGQPSEILTDGLPRHAKIATASSDVRQGMLSPSVYSRATDGASPRPLTPEEHGGTIITITGREVKSYSISPPKNRQPSTQRTVHASSEWRKWLSDEMYGFADPPINGGFTLPTETAAESSLENAGASDQSAQPERSRKDQQSCDSPPPGEQTRPQRPRASSGKSSFMNERYPMVESSRNSSRQSARKYSQSSVRPVGSREISSGDERKSSGLGASSQTAKVAREYALESSESLEATRTMRPSNWQTQKPYSMSGALPEPNASANKPLEDTAKASQRSARSRAKSAFDLRATYKANKSTATVKPLEVRRKPATTANISVFEDSTIQNISAGPYASTNTLYPSDANKENTPTQTNDDNALPALSSSEWLARPPNKRRVTTAASQTAQRSASRYSPVRGQKQAGNEGSPGQRLVTGWLEGRRPRGRDESPAFV